MRFFLIFLQLFILFFLVSCKENSKKEVADSKCYEIDTVGDQSEQVEKNEVQDVFVDNEVIEAGETVLDLTDGEAIEHDVIPETEQTEPKDLTSEVIPYECPNLPNSFNDDIKVKGAGEKTVFDCITKPDCFEFMVSSHRGFHYDDIPENSIPAILKAIETGADIVEIDVRVTKDNVLVLMHDKTVDSTTDGTGNVSDFTLEELKKLHLKDRATGKVYPEFFVPTLKEALEVSKGKVILNLDIKTSNMELIAKFYKENSAYPYAIARSSSNDKLLILKSKDSKIVIMPNFDDPSKFEEMIEKFNPSIVEIHSNFKDEITFLHGKGIKVLQDSLGPVDFVGVKLCTDEYWLSFVERGVDVIQTDFPQFVCPIVKGYEKVK